MMKVIPNRSPLLLAGLLLVLVSATGCIPTRIGVSWAGLTTMGERQNILVVYNDFMVLVDPATGDEAPLLNEAGNPRIDPQTNETRPWEIAGQQGIQFFSLPVQVDDDTLLVADYNKRLFYVDLNTARIENPAGTAISGQVVADLLTDGERVFLPDYNYNIAALDLETLEQDWLLETENGVWSEPLLHEGTLYFGSMDHHLYSVNAADGSVNWKIDLGGAVAGSPTVYEGSLYVGSFDRKLFEISLDGEILNTFETENWVWGSPVVKDGVLYAADMAGWVYAINVTDGMTEVWRTAASGRGIRPSPLVTEEYIVVAGRDGHIDWLDVEDGSIAIQREVQAEVLSDILLIQPSESLNIAQPLVVISTVNHSQILVAFTLNDGTQFWVYGR